MEVKKTKIRINGLDDISVDISLKNINGWNTSGILRGIKISLKKNIKYHLMNI